MRGKKNPLKTVESGYRGTYVHVHVLFANTEKEAFSPLHAFQVQSMK